MPELEATQEGVQNGPGRAAHLRPEQLTIRRIEPGDATALQRVAAGRAAYGGTLQMPYVSEAQWMQRLQVDDQNHIALAALYEGEVIGHTGLKIEPNLRRRHAAHVGIMVADAYAGRGVGDALMRALLDIADNWAQILRLELTVFADNARAQRLYEKHGFVREGLLRAYAMRDGRLHDAWSMARLHPQQPLVSPGLAESPAAPVSPVSAPSAPPVTGN